jgi:hypothetical protein
MIHPTQIDRLEVHTDEEAERAAQERRIAALEAQAADLTEWLTELGEDMLRRTTPRGAVGKPVPAQ